MNFCMIQFLARRLRKVLWVYMIYGFGLGIVVVLRMLQVAEYRSTQVYQLVEAVIDNNGN